MVKIGYIIKGYEIIEQIGVGGNSCVYKVTKDNKTYAMKIMKRALYREKLKRYNDEVDFQIKAEHKNIVKIYDKGTIAIADSTVRLHFYIMDLYSSSFRELLNKKIDINELLKLYKDICKALSYCHKNGIIHRDLKPENFLYDEKNKRLLLADFGIACFENQKKHITGDEKIGNFSYSAPEQRQIKNKHYSKSTDIYAMGLILGEIITGIIPAGFEFKHFLEEMPLYNSYIELLEKMLEPNVEKRESSILSVIRELSFVEKEIANELEDYELNYGDQNDNIKMSDDLNKKNIRKTICSDIYLIFEFLPKFQKLENLNYNYHYNLKYKYNKNFADSLKLIKLYELVKHKFDYECSSINTITNLDSNNFQITKNESYDRLKKLIEQMNFYSDGFLSLSSLRTKILRLFVMLTDYHQLEIFEELKIDDIDKGHCFFEVLSDMSLLNKYENFINDHLNYWVFFELDTSNYLSFLGDENLFVHNQEEEMKYIKMILDNYQISIKKKIHKYILISDSTHFINELLDTAQDLLEHETSCVTQGDYQDAIQVLEEILKYGSSMTDGFVIKNILIERIIKAYSNKTILNDAN